MKEKACKSCHLITTANFCPNCKTSTLSDDWIGELIVFDPDKSMIAKYMEITKPGRYALRVRG
jgi:DNA-directed RNA polymerase subunit E"